LKLIKLNRQALRLIVITALTLFFAVSPVFSTETGADNGEVIELGEDAVIEEDPVELLEEIEFIEGELEKMPALIEFVEAVYHEKFIKDGVEGGVLLELLVNEAGGVDSVSVVRPLHPVLDESAMEAARKFKFSPAQAGGEAVAVMLQYEYRFSLKEVVTIPDKYVNFSGRLLERGTRVPIPDALVVLEFADTLCDTSLSMPFSLYMEQIGKIEGQAWEDGRLAAATDSLGAFRFYSLPACKVQVKSLLPDYEPFTSEERIGKLEEVSVVYYVRRTDYADYELVVYGKVEEKEVSRRQISIAEVKRIPGLGGDAVRIVQAMPGVARPSFGGAQVVVRGAPGWASAYYIDGVTVPLLYHMAGTTSIYPSDALDGVDFYPGGWGARYGGAVGGVIEMKSRNPKTDRIQGYADLNMLNGEAFIEGPINERVSFMASGRRGFAGDILSLYFKYADPTSAGISMAPFYWDYLLRTDVAASDNHHLSVQLIGSRDSIGVLIPGLDNGSTEIDENLDELNTKVMFHSFIVGLDSRLSGGWSNQLRLSGSYVNSRMSAFGMAKLEENDYIGHLRNQVSYRASEKLTVNAGADAQLLNASLNMTVTTEYGIFWDTLEVLTGVVGGYVNVEWKPVERVLIIPGVRYDYYPELDYNGSLLPAFWDYGLIDNRRGVSGEPSFRVNGRYEFIDGHTAKAAVGSYSKSPEPTGMVIDEIWGETDMPAVKAAQYVAGYEWQITDLLNLDAQTYYNTMWDVARSYSGGIDYDSTRANRDERQRRYLSDGKDRTYGLELMLRHQRSERFFGWISYTLSRSETWSKRDGKYILSSRDEPHHLQLLGSWRFPRNIDFGVRTRFVSGKPTSPIIATTESENGKRIRPVYGERNSTRMDPFFQVDMRLDRKMIYKKWILSTYLDLQNVSWLFYRSPEMVYWNYNYTESRNISMIPMMAFGVRAEF
jgi:TonB family protein